VLVAAVVIYSKDHINDILNYRVLLNEEWTYLVIIMMENIAINLLEGTEEGEYTGYTEKEQSEGWGHEGHSI